MNKDFFILLMVLSRLSVFDLYSQTNDTIIAWNENRPLTWDDFKIKKPKKENLYGACLYTDIVLWWEGDYEDPLIVAVAYPLKSWSVPKYESAYALEHEQIHFDITKLYAIKMKEAIQNCKVKNLENIRKIYDSVINKLKEAQDRYDRETFNSILTYDQMLWKYNIRSQLRQYGYYQRKFDTLKCRDFHNGKFKYHYHGEEITVIRKDSIHELFTKDKTKDIRYKIKWMDACTGILYNPDYIAFPPSYGDKFPKFKNKFPDEKIFFEVVNIDKNVFEIIYVSDKYNELHKFKFVKIK